MTNKSLKNDLKELLSNPGNISSVKKGGISNFSIEIETKEPLTQCSYTYYDNKQTRDLDFEELISEINR